MDVLIIVYALVITLIAVAEFRTIRALQRERRAADEVVDAATKLIVRVIPLLALSDIARRDTLRRLAPNLEYQRRERRYEEEDAPVGVSPSYSEFSHNVDEDPPPRIL